MMATGNDTKDRPDIGESYATSVSSSNLRVGEHGSSAADMIVAAGMSTQRVGMALMRLMSEWDANAKPSRLTPERVKELAGGLERVAGGEHAGLVAVTEDGKTEYRLPLVVAARMADDWYAHELGILFQRMKTLPYARTGIIWWAENTAGIEDAIHVVAAVLQWWLSQTCPSCHGVKLRIVAGTGRTGSRPCGTCKGSGEAKVPHGWQGRKVLGYIYAARAAAVRDLRLRIRPPKQG